MPSCAILECRNKSGSHNLSRGGISYHRFPNDPDIKAEWILATGRQHWEPSKTSTICSKHFEPEDYVIKDGGRHYLHSVAVPSRYHAGYLEMNSSESTSDCVNSIEVEITPENSIVVNPQQNMCLDSNDTSRFNLDYTPRTHGEDIRLIKIMQAKIQEQELMIRKLKVRNYRLKKRLFSLKSMEN